MTVRVRVEDDLGRMLESAAEGDVFELEAGTHEVVAPIVLRVALTIRGEGGGAVLRGAPAGPLLVLNARQPIEVADLALVHERRIDGTEAPGHHVVQVQAGEARFVGCRFAGARAGKEQGGAGLLVASKAVVTLRACVAEENEVAGVLAVEDARAEAEGCVFRRNGVGVWFQQRSGGLVRGCTAEANRRFGFMVTDRASPTLVENRIEANGAPGVAVAGDARPLMVDNKLDPADMPEPRVADEDDLRNPENVLRAVRVPPIVLELGMDCVTLADSARGGKLVELTTPMRVAVAMETGFVTPGVQFKDNPSLPEQGYRILVKGTVVATGSVQLGRLLAIRTAVTDLSRPVDGEPVSEPVHGDPAYWVTPEQAEAAVQLGYAVHEPASVITAHLASTITAHAWEILSRDEVQYMLNQTREVAIATVDELVPDRLSLGVVHQALARLLRERVSIRDMRTILDVFADMAVWNQDPQALAEAARKRLSRAICASLADEQGIMRIVAFEPEVERRLPELIAPEPDLPAFEALQRRRGALELVDQLLLSVPPELQPGLVLVVSPSLRPALAAFLADPRPTLRVLATDELHPSFRYFDPRG